ncbi:MAG: MlaD family protein [Deltaproteobacteria bacterium]|nr:MlaD family protein [Deltaproteobacteria bacterium]
MKLNKETKVGIFTVVVLFILVYFSMKVGKIYIFKPSTYTISAYFTSANGIGTGTNVEMAGIKVGTVKRINLEHGKARVYMEINSKYKIYPDYIASIRSMSLLGESYISITPANAIQSLTSKPVPENEIIKSYESPENMSNLILKFAKTADNLEHITSSLKNSIGNKTGEHKIKAILSNVAELSDNLDKLVYLNQKNFNVMMTNFAGFSRNINGLTLKNDRALTRTIHNFRAISDNLRQELPSITNNIKTVSANLSDILTKNKSNINRSLAHIRKDSKQLQLSLNQIYGISSKINEGKGTVGKLVNRNSVYDNLNGSLKGINNLVGGFNRFKIKMNMNSQYLVKSNGSVTEVNIRLQPSPGHYYVLGVDSAPVNYGNSFGETQTTTYTTNNPPSGEFYPSSITTNTTQYSNSNNIKFNAEIAKNFYNWTFLAGLMYSTGGVGINYYIPETNKNLELYARAFGFNSNNGSAEAYVNAGISYTFFKHLFVDTGFDDIFSKNNNRSLFVGGGIKFTDKDLEYLIAGSKMP